MGILPVPHGTTLGIRDRWAVQYAISGDLRFISHHDTLRLFRRALARAALPVRFSEGFNPLPRMSVPLPRPLGVASVCEFIVIDLIQILDPQELQSRLAAQMPEGLTIMHVRCLNSGERLIPDLVRYHLVLDPSTSGDLPDRIARVLDAKKCPVVRCDGNGRTRTLDVRPYLVGVRPTADGVEFTVKVTGAGAAKPSEIAALLGCDPQSINHQITRLHVGWAPTGIRNDDTVHDQQQNHDRQKQEKNRQTQEEYVLGAR